MASVWDSEEAILQRYDGAALRLRNLRQAGAEIAFGVDAANLDRGPLAGAMPFDRTVDPEKEVRSGPL